MIKKIFLFTCFCLLNLSSIAQSKKDLIIIDEIQSPQYKGVVSTPVFNLEKIKLNKKIIASLGVEIEKFLTATRKYREADMNNELDSIEYYKRDSLLKFKYGVTAAERMLKKILLKILPQTHYCGYKLTGNRGLQLIFYDNTVIYLYFDHTDKKAPLLVSYILDSYSAYGKRDYGTLATNIKYYANGNIKYIMSSRRENYPISEYYGFYGLYNENGTIIKETNLEKEFKHNHNSILGFYGNDQGYDVLDRVTHRYICDDAVIQPASPSLIKVYDTNYGNIWIINYARTRIRDRNKPYKDALNDQMNSVENVVRIVRDDTGEVIVEELLNKCFNKKIPIEGKGYRILTPDALIWESWERKEDVDVMKWEKEQNKVLILLKSLPYSPIDFLEKS